ncbi:MAG TPA: acyl-CoA dehydrogenase family protein [Povalibacter sp.]|uniref:acyl-CoA dehydrogenase family protein n=1 Tax=Povalibacter sp. TaxID=1962978 RepID=UPI002BFC9DB3|nr:acyl-CoA dehydrogenase family protein [Povalibacter sp.]HMN45924.1 acyl-CoA dehydrogenase family protein [Povalibacter sp.]
MTSEYTSRARALAQQVAAKFAEATDREARFPQETVAALREQRFFGMMVPTDDGGDGARLDDVAAVCVELAQGCASSAMIFAMHNIKLASLISHGQQSPWHRQFMGRIANEQLLLASATTEAGIGGDLRSSVCAVRTDGDNFELAKDATVISYGVHADAILVSARRHPEAPPSDQVLVAVLKNQYRLERISDWDTLGMRGTCSEGHRLTARAPTEQILPKPFAEIAAQSMLSSSHLLWSSVWFGIASDALARAQAFVRAEARKKPGTTPPGALRLAEASAMLQSVRSQIVAGLKRFDEARRDEEDLMSLGFAVAMNNLKVNVSQMVAQIVQHALLICGIQGYRNNTPYSLGRHLRDAQSAALMISNDRILSNTSTMLLAHRHETGLF